MLEPESTDCKSHLKRITDRTRLSPVQRVLAIVGTLALIGIAFKATTWTNIRGNLNTEASMGNLDLSKAVNGFGSTLFANFDADAKKGNAAFLSPWGIAHALSMVLEGAKTGSASHTQLLNVVFSAKESEHSAVRSSVQTLTTNMTSSKNGDALTISDANSAWVKSGVKLLEGYVKSLETFFRAQARPLTGAAVVNSWVEEATHGKIKTIITEGQAADAALVLVNAIYFKGLWQESFPEKGTGPLQFRKLDGSRIDAPMMFLHLKKGTAVQGTNLEATLPGTSNKVPCVAVKMAYQGGTYSAVAAMPVGDLKEDSPGGKLTLESGQDYADALTSCRETVVAGLGHGNNGKHGGDSNSLLWKTIGDPTMKAIKIYLPRFEIEFGTSLAPALKKAGLGAIFQPGDFTGITAEGSLAVSDVVHKVYVKVDEKGTEAAAATAAIMMKMAMTRPPPELFVNFNRPFVFSVIHEESGLALFTGEVYKPEEWKQK